jgi:hypothetical protein
MTIAPVAITLGTLTPVPPGTSITGVATLLAGHTYSGTMNLSCTLTGSPSGAQSPPTCSLNPSSITVTSGQSGTTALTVHTTTATIVVAQSDRGNMEALGGGAIFAAVFMFGISSRRRRWNSLLVLICMITFAGAVVGCGGSGSISSARSTEPATTSGSYTFTVTGADSVNPAITNSTNFTITVQ